MLTFESSNVNIELNDYVKVFQRAKNLTKILVFKGTSCFNSKEAPLAKILMLMDLTMISSNIYKPELTSCKTINVKEYQKIDIVEKKVKHYEKILMNCAKEIYGVK